MSTCPRCKKPIKQGETTGQSSLYGAHDIGELHEACFFDEDAQIEEAGTNNIPETLAKYRQ